MYTFTISRDYYLIRDTVISGNNIPYNFQDGEDPKHWKPNLAANILHIKVCRDNEFLGFFFLIRKGERVAEAHMAFLPHAYGQVINIGKKCLEWIWKYLPINTLVAPCIEDNRLALRVIKGIGFEVYDRTENAWLRDGKQHHYLWLRINRESYNKREEV